MVRGLLATPLSDLSLRWEVIADQELQGVNSGFCLMNWPASIMPSGG